MQMETTIWLETDVLDRVRHMNRFNRWVYAPRNKKRAKYYALRHRGK